MNEEKKKILHLLVPKEFQVWCRKSKPPGKDMRFTRLPSKATCANCLTAFRSETKHLYRPFRKSHTPDYDFPPTTK